MPEETKESEALISIRVDTIRDLEDVTTVTELQAYIDEIREVVPPEHLDSVSIKIYTEEVYEGSHYVAVDITYDRPETAYEREVREARETIAREGKERSERRLYEELSKKYAAK
jgi:hypothetical protein